MEDHPLAAPVNTRLLESFRAGCRLPSAAPPLEAVRQIAAAFARLPYENLTKIIKRHVHGTNTSARRGPAEVLSDHFRYGAGGTCFSLTATLLHLLRSLGWRVEPVLADRRYGANTHCALLIWIEDRPHLLDPGYLIVAPIPVDVHGEQRIQTAFNRLVLKPLADGEKIELHTVDGASTKYRLTFKTSPADASEFLRAWDDSFSWDMMQYPLLTCTRGGQQLYVHGDRLQVRDLLGVSRREIDPAQFVSQISATFGIDASLCQRALQILTRGGAWHG